MIGGPNWYGAKMINKKLTSEAVVPDIWAGRSGVEPVVRTVKGSLVRRLADEVDVGLLAAAALVAASSSVVEAQSHAVTHWNVKRLNGLHSYSHSHHFRGSVKKQSRHKHGVQQVCWSHFITSTAIAWYYFSSLKKNSISFYKTSIKNMVLILCNAFLRNFSCIFYHV